MKPPFIHPSPTCGFSEKLAASLDLTDVSITPIGGGTTYSPINVSFNLSTKTATFNFANGDVFTIREVWPAVADAMGMEVGEDRPASLAAWLPAQRETWAALLAQHQAEHARDPLVRAAMKSIALDEARHAALAWTIEVQKV